MTGILPLMRRQDQPLASVVVLSVTDDGARRYDQVDPSKVIRGTELSPYLHREMWHAPPHWVGAGGVAKPNSAFGGSLSKGKSSPSSPVSPSSPISPSSPSSTSSPHVDASCRSNVSRYSTKSSVKEHTCPVCLDELREGCLVSRFSCSHVLHFECACSWLSSRICAGKSGTCPLWFAPPRFHLPPCRCWRSAVAAFEIPQEQPSRVLHDHSIVRDTHLAEAADLLCIMTLCSNYVVCAPVFEAPKLASSNRVRS